MSIIITGLVLWALAGRRRDNRAGVIRPTWQRECRKTRLRQGRTPWRELNHGDEGGTRILRLEAVWCVGLEGR